MSVKEIKTSSELSKNIFDQVLFFSIAETGAMGEPGGIVVINASGEVFLLNYAWYDYSIHDIERLFPTLKKCSFGLFGLDSIVPKGWNYVNLGFGNHLIVANSVYGEFWEQAKDYKEPGECYAKWHIIAREMLGIPIDEETD